MERVLIIGCAGAGKTTLARALAARTGLPVIHLDRHYWRAGWVPTPAPEWALAVEALAAGPRWIIDGNYANSLAPRLARADAVVFLDFPRSTCLRRALWRSLRGWGRERPDMAPGCREQISPGFFRWSWNFPRDSRPRLVAQLGRHAGPAHVLRSAAEVRAFLDGVPAA